MLECNPYCRNPCCCNPYCCIVLAVSDLASYLQRTRIAVLLADDEPRENSAASGPDEMVGPAPMKRFAVSLEQRESGAPRVSVEGEIDRSTVDVVRLEAIRQIESHGPGRHLVRTSLMDSSAQHLIEALTLRTSEQEGALVVVVATYGVRRLLEVAPPPRDVLVAVARSRRGAAVTNWRLSPHSGQTVAA
jgi:hypothetical protein